MEAERWGQKNGGQEDEGGEKNLLCRTAAAAVADRRTEVWTLFARRHTPCWSEFHTSRGRDSPEGCQTVAGGRSVAETPGTVIEIKLHPGRVPEQGWHNFCAPHRLGSHKSRGSSFTGRTVIRSFR